MRILQISNKAPYPPNDGSSIAVYNMAKGFIQNNVDFHFITINTKKHFKSDALVPDDFKKKSHYTSVYKNTGIKPIGAILNLFTNESYFISRFVFKEFESELISCLIKHEFDIVQIEGIFMAPYIPIIRKHSKAKITIRTHNAEHVIWDRLIQNEGNELKKQYLQLQNKRLKKTEIELLGIADAIIPITPTDKIIFEELEIKSNYFISPTGIDIDRYQIDYSKEKPITFFHLGSMDWMPNVEGVDWFLKEVYLPYFQNNEAITFNFAGRFMPKRFLEQSSKNLQFIGSVEDNISFYNQHDVMLVPLQSGSGMRIKIIEGMAMGKAIISTSIGAEGIPVTHLENIIIADNPKEFADAITDLAKNDELKLKLKKNARSFIQNHFDNKNLVNQLLIFYKDLTR
jgi:glycosyltransferase involved in cell wall biosynthesis